MASKSAYQQTEVGAEIEGLLDTLDLALDRLKVMYEQYFLGIAKVAPSHLHTDAERKLREISQIQIRNTALRYRFATLQQKYASYNSYWRRTTRQIEQGTYVRSLSKVKRKYENAAGDIPEEILAAMPKRMRDQVARDRVVAVAQAGRRGQLKDGDPDAGIPDAGIPDADYDLLDASDLVDHDDDVARISSPPPREHGGIVHRVDTAEMDELDIEQMLADMAAPDVARPVTAKVKPPIQVKPPVVVAPVRPPVIESARPVRRDETQPGVGMPPAMPALPPPPAKGAPPSPTAAAAPPPAPQPPQRPSRPSVQAATIPHLASAPRPSARPPAPGATGPAPRTPTAPPARAATNPGGPGPARPVQPRADALPPGMTEADVRTLYQKYARARELVGERNDDTTYQALLRTLHQQAPKIMAQYKAKTVEFGVVIKDKQVVLKAKPKT